jgi:hypothetical protein
VRQAENYASRANKIVPLGKRLLLGALEILLQTRLVDSFQATAMPMR